MCIFAIFLRRYLVKTVVKSKRRYLLNGSCDFFLVFTKRSSGGSSFWWTPWFMVEIFFGNNTSLVRCALALLCLLHYSSTDLLNQSPPDLELKESSENCLEKNIGICFFYRLFFSNKTSCNSKKKRYSQALC